MELVLGGIVIPSDDIIQPPGPPGPPGPSGRGWCPPSHVCTWRTSVHLFVSVLKQKVFVRRQWNFLGNMPRHTASQGKNHKGLGHPGRMPFWYDVDHHDMSDLYCTWRAPVQLFISVLKQKVFVRRQWNFLGNMPRHTASQGKKLQGARTSRNDVILILRRVNFYFAGCSVRSVLSICQLSDFGPPARILSNLAVVPK